jgi:hypothetical protein
MSILKIVATAKKPFAATSAGTPAGSTGMEATQERPDVETTRDSRELFGRLYCGGLILVGGAILAAEAPQFDGSWYLLGLFIALNMAVEVMPIVVYGQSYISA